MTPIKAIRADAVYPENLFAACNCMTAPKNPIKKKENMSPKVPIAKGMVNILDDKFKNSTPSSRIVSIDFKWDRKEQNRHTTYTTNPSKLIVPITLCL